MQQPAHDDSDGEEQKNQERQRHVQPPEEEAHFDDRDVLNHEEDRQTGDDQAQDQFEMHGRALNGDAFQLVTLQERPVNSNFSIA
jgi:hypothetical protein